MSHVYPRATQNYLESLIPTFVPISVLTQDERFINYSDAEQRLKMIQHNIIISPNNNNGISEKPHSVHQQQDENNGQHDG